MIKIDFKEFDKFKLQVVQLSKKEVHEFNEKLIRELAYRLLALVKQRTPVNQGIPNDVNHNGGGGTLRNAWTVGKVVKIGNEYHIEVFNPMHYASYVEYGHRGVYVPELGVTLHLEQRHTEGVHMLRISKQDLEKIAPQILDKKLDKFIRDKFGS